MTLDDIELGNGRFNRVRLSIEDDLKIIDDVVLKYKPEILDKINSLDLRFTPFQRGALSNKDISKYNSNNISKFIVNEPILAYYTVEVVLDAIKSDIHNKGLIFNSKNSNTSRSRVFSVIDTNLPLIVAYTSLKVG